MLQNYSLIYWSHTTMLPFHVHQYASRVIIARHEQDCLSLLSWCSTHMLEEYVIGSLMMITDQDVIGQDQIKMNLRPESKTAFHNSFRDSCRH